MELRDYLRILRKRWMLVVLVTVLTVGSAAAVTLSTTPQYASSIRLFVSTSAGSDVTEQYQGGLFTQQRVASYADLLAGERLADAVIDDLGLERGTEDVRSAITASVVPETVLLTATVTDPSPQVAQQMAQSLAAQFTELITELETPPGSDVSTVKVTLVADPGLPTSPVSPQPLRNLALATVLGLLLGVGLAVLREVLDTSVKTTEDLSERGLAPLGVTVHDPKALDHPVLLSGTARTPQAEAFRQLRTNLQFIDVDRPPRTVVITSSLPAEGKTTTAINLALALSMGGMRTVLVDAELRRSRVASYMNLVGEVGLTSVLAGRADLNDVLQPYGTSGLVVLPSGPIPPNPSELLGSQHMSGVLATLAERFDIVILDSPPLLPVTDAAVLARLADGAIVVARHGRTTRDQLTTAVERLRSVDAKLLGGILTVVPTRGADAGSYGYGYGYEPDKEPEGEPAVPTHAVR